MLSGPSLSLSPSCSHLICALARHSYKWFQDTERGQSLDIWDSFTFLLVCAFPAFFPFFFSRRWNFKGPKRNRAGIIQAKKKTQAWSSHRDPYGCRAVVMSLSAHLLWLPSSLWRYPWGQNSCAFMCVWKDEFERVSKKCLEDNPAAVSICQDSGYILQIQYELKKLPVKYKVLNDDQKGWYS